MIVEDRKHLALFRKLQETEAFFLVILFIAF